MPSKEAIRRAISRKRKKDPLGFLPPILEEVGLGMRAGERVAKEEIGDFKALFTEKVTAVLTQIEKTWTDTDTAISEACTEFARETREFLEKYQGELDSAEVAFLEKISTLRGPKGEPGKPGRDGRDGKSTQGKDGRDGSPDTPGDIVKKLESLTGVQRLDKSAIKGLEEQFREIMKELREARKQMKKEQGGGGSGGGGGLGNVQHEVFSISAGTTGVTTAFPIAGGGNAIFKAAYEGQELDKDVHFTIGGNRKDITFDSGVQAQFQNGTKFSVTYIRG